MDGILRLKSEARYGHDDSGNRVAFTQSTTIPRAMRQRVEAILDESYAFMESTIPPTRTLRRRCSTSSQEPQLPMVSWYQPTRDEAVDQTIAGAPQLMKGDEERTMFLRFNYSKLRLGKLQKLIKKSGLTANAAEEFIYGIADSSTSANTWFGPTWRWCWPWPSARGWAMSISPRS